MLTPIACLTCQRCNGGIGHLVDTHGHRLELAGCSQLVYHRAVHFEIACRRNSRLSDKDMGCDAVRALWGACACGV